jgi:hypothetical protein
MKGISFDLQEKRGTAFNLVDSFATGTTHHPPMRAMLDIQLMRIAMPALHYSHHSIPVQVL